MQKLPVLMIVFNRPETTERVFSAVRQYAPERLYVSADGPRPDKPDAENCAAVRKIFDRVDWPCEVKTRFRERNLGCRKAPPDGISWFFEQEEEGVILEDDCLPSPDFFRFCAEMLERYRDNKRVMHIGGANFLGADFPRKASYYFSNNPHIWGWASWQRAWQHYDNEMTEFPAYCRSGRIARRIPGRPFEQWRFLQQMKATYDHSPYFNTWDWQWTFTLFNSDGLSIIPNFNMISNIGFSGTHTVQSSVCALPYAPLPETLIHPSEIRVDHQADSEIFQYFYKGTWKDRVHYWNNLLTLRFRNGIYKW